MTDLERILITAAVTVAGGVTVLMVGQVVSRFLIEPIYELRKLRGTIADALIYYAHYFSDSVERPFEEVRDASDKFRQLAAELMARTIGVPGYRLLGWLRLIPPFQDIINARRALFGLSNCLHRADWQRKHKLAAQAAFALGVADVDKQLFDLDTSDAPSLPAAGDHKASPPQG